MLRTRVIRQKISLKIIVFATETPCWCPSVGLWHGDRKPVGTSGVYFGSLKTLLLSVKLENIRIGTSLDIFGYSELENIRRIDIFVQVTCDLERMPMSRIVEKLSVLFLIQRSLPSWSYASRYLFKNDFYLTREFLILVFLTSRENQELSTFRSYNRSQGWKLSYIHTYT